MTAKTALRREIPSEVRKSEVWRRCALVIAEVGQSPLFGRAKNHWFVQIEAGGAPRKHFLPISAGDRCGVNNNVAQLRRLLRMETV